MLCISTKITNDVELYNDNFFNTNTYDTVLKRDDLKRIIEKTEGVSFLGDLIISKFNGVPISLSKISTGCKTLLNIIAFPDKTFSIMECGSNILDIVYTLNNGHIYCSERYLPYIECENMYEIDGVKVKGIDGLEGWWNNVV